MRATRTLIHIDRFCENLNVIGKIVGPGPAICVPVKADAYGHGAIPIARAALSAGAKYLAVATVDEGAELRAAGIEAPILLLSLPLGEELPQVVACSLSPLIGDRDFVDQAAKAAGRAGKKLQVHLKIDTGMGRVGCRPEDAADMAAYIAGLPSLEYRGTATHLAVSDSDKPEDRAYTKQQLGLFRDAVADIRARGLDPGIVHAANSGAIAFHPDSYLDMVRPGIVLYGYGPVPEVKPVMELVTNIVFTKRVKQGESVSYGRTWIAPRDTTVATVPVGYGDGLPRRLSGNFSVLIRDAFYPLAGRICMDQCMIDLGPDASVQRGEEVVIFGGKALNAADIAERLGTIPYEITCDINKRVPRVYLGLDK
jgi:alanine racemase